MIQLQETTVWTNKQVNHTYWTNESKDKLFAFQPKDGDKVVFDVPLKFNTSKRTFKVIK